MFRVNYVLSIGKHFLYKKTAFLQSDLQNCILNVFFMHIFAHVLNVIYIFCLFVDSCYLDCSAMWRLLWKLWSETLCLYTGTSRTRAALRNITWHYLLWTSPWISHVCMRSFTFWLQTEKNYSKERYRSTVRKEGELQECLLHKENKITYQLSFFIVFMLFFHWIMLKLTVACAIMCHAVFCSFQSIVKFF